MTHFLALVLYGLLVSIGFAVLTSEHQTTAERIIYAGKAFLYFVGIGYLISWALFFLPR